MLFATLDFLLFIVPVLAAYWLLVDRPGARTALLIGASYFFYMASPRPPDGSLPPAWYFAGLLAVSTVLDYVCSARIHARAPDLDTDDLALADQARRARRRWLTASLVGNLGLLGYFKYTNFFLEVMTDLANAAGADWVAPHLDLILPIGISFYTFQSLSYTIDVYRRRLTPEPNFWKFALFVVFFPQLVAGPIVRASEFLPQLHRRPTLNLSDVEEATWRIFKGLAKKVILGDWIAASFADLVFATPEAFSSLENLLALYAFTLQIYADFSGYSDIAIGVARLLGFKIPENFDRPYQARTLAEFWRRWHMTLSTWLRDYLFFPLGGSRGSAARTYFNLWLTMFLVGMWHGASWNFVIYSNVHGLAMVFNRWNRLRAKKEGATATSQALAVGGVALGLGLVSFGLGHSLLLLSQASSIKLGVFAAVMLVLGAYVPADGSWTTHVARLVMTFHFTVISRIFFRAEDLDLARQMSTKLVEWDFRGVRPGLFRVQGMSAWAEGLEQAPAALKVALVGLAEYGLLIVLVLGTAYHFTPREWVEERLRGVFVRLPGPVLGIAFALLAVIIMNLLSGPRANIYFAF